MSGLEVSQESDVTSQNADNQNSLDSIPTSSTDANTTFVKTATALVEDPISSTSSDVCSTKNEYLEDDVDQFTEDLTASDINLIIMGQTNPAPAKRDDPETEEEFLNLNIGNEAESEITEDVEDIVQDLENLLGESPEGFSVSEKKELKIDDVTVSNDLEEELDKLTEVAKQGDCGLNDHKVVAVPAEEVSFAADDVLPMDSCSAFTNEPPGQELEETMEVEPVEELHQMNASQPETSNDDDENMEVDTAEVQDVPFEEIQELELNIQNLEEDIPLNKKSPQKVRLIRSPLYKVSEEMEVLQVGKVDSGRIEDIPPLEDIVRAKESSEEVEMQSPKEVAEEPIVSKNISNIEPDIMEVLPESAQESPKVVELLPESTFETNEDINVADTALDELISEIASSSVVTEPAMETLDTAEPSEILNASEEDDNEALPAAEEVASAKPSPRECSEVTEGVLEPCRETAVSSQKVEEKQDGGFQTPDQQVVEATEILECVTQADAEEYSAEGEENQFNECKDAVKEQKVEEIRADIDEDVAKPFEEIVESVVSESLSKAAEEIVLHEDLVAPVEENTNQSRFEADIENSQVIETTKEDNTEENEIVTKTVEERVEDSQVIETMKYSLEENEFLTRTVEESVDHQTVVTTKNILEENRPEVTAPTEDNIQESELEEPIVEAKSEMEQQIQESVAEPSEEFLGCVEEQIAKEPREEFCDVVGEQVQETPEEPREEISGVVKEQIQEIPDEPRKEISGVIKEQIQEILDEPREEISGVVEEEMQEIPDEPREDISGVVEEEMQKVPDEPIVEISDVVEEQIQEIPDEPREEISGVVEEQIQKMSDEARKEISGVVEEQIQEILDGPREEISGIQEIPDESTEEISSVVEEQLQEIVQPSLPPTEEVSMAQEEMPDQAVCELAREGDLNDELLRITQEFEDGKREAECSASAIEDKAVVEEPVHAMEIAEDEQELVDAASEVIQETIDLTEEVSSTVNDTFQAENNVHPKEDVKIREASCDVAEVPSSSTASLLMQAVNPDLKTTLTVNISDDDTEEEKEAEKSQAEADKHLLKITITKQSNSNTHSILKVCSPNEASSSSLSPRTASPKATRQSYSPKIPKVTIKPIVKPELSPLKLTIKPIQKPEEHEQKPSPKLTIKPIIKPDEVKQRGSPKLTIKPIPKPEEMEEERKSSPKLIIKPIPEPVPKLTIKPIVKPEEQSHSPKITIKPIVKPDEEQEHYSPRIIIKSPVKPPEHEEVQSEEIKRVDSPKVIIKPIVQPQETVEILDYEDQIKQERIILKINKKGAVPSRKREHSEETERLAKIKVKYSKEGGHAHIVPPADSVVNEETDFRKRFKLENFNLPQGITITNVAPSRQQHFPAQVFQPELLMESSVSEDVCDLQASMQEERDPLGDIPIFEISSDTAPEQPSPSTIPTSTPVQAPRKRGRPRKVPLQVREDFKDLKDDVIIVEDTKDEPKQETPSRPKRSCRGTSARDTLGIKPRKPRGPGRGRGGKRGGASRVSSPPKTVEEHSVIVNLTGETPGSSFVEEALKEFEPTVDLTGSPTPILPPSTPETSKDVPIFEEETRMSAETSSRAQTPAKQISTVVIEVEESQSSVQSSATSESAKVRKGPRLEVHQEPEGAVISADQLAEYSWGGGGPYMLQEQVAQFLGIKSFKRKYPGIQRRPVEMQERDFIRESGLASEAMCDLGLTAVNSADILDIMYSDFQPKYEEYCKHQRDRQAKDLTNKQKALTLAATQEKNKLDITEQAIQSAASWNSNFNKTRREQRKACMDLQTFTINFPKGRMKQINKQPIGHYPVALVPGQFTDYYKVFTPTEINNLPLNTMCYDPINIRHDDDSQSDGSGSDSDSSSSDSDSSDSVSSENCTVCSSKAKQISVR